VAARVLQASATNDSIPEEDHLKKSVSGSGLVASERQGDESISEESYLQDVTAPPEDAEPAYVPPKPIVQTFSKKKVDRI
jgi:hypothetical protein